MNHYLVYKHIRKDNNKVFYIGCSGNYNRPYDFKRRTTLWKEAFKETEIKVEIIEVNLSKQEALDLELNLIKSHDGLVNLYGNGYKSWNVGKKLSKQHRLNLKKNSGVARKVICTKTNKVYPSIVDASKDSIYSMPHVKNMLKGIRTNKTSFIWA